MSKTIFALATGNQVSALSVIRVSGEECSKIIKKLTKKKAPQERVLTLRRFYCPKNRSKLIDNCLFAWMQAPSSYTGEDCLEIYSHGGEAVFQAFFEALNSFQNVSYAEQGEFSKRAIINGKTNLIKAEAVNDLIKSQTEEQRALALRQLDNGLSVKLNIWRKKLIKCMALVEATIDFSDEEDTPDEIDIEKDLLEIKKEIKNALNNKNYYELISYGTKVALTGKPNVGKSSLFNAIIKRQKSIVTDIPGTTRDIIEGSINLKGFPVIFFDTAGITKSKDKVEQEGIKRASRLIEKADIVLNIFDKTDDFKKATGKKWNYLNKIDKLNCKTEFGADQTNLISVKTGEGIESLLNNIYCEVSKKTSYLKETSSLVSNARQAAELEEALIYINQALKEQNSPELVGENLREASRSLARILGVIDIEEVLGKIFSSFCIGK